MTNLGADKSSLRCFGGQSSLIVEMKGYKFYSEVYCQQIPEFQFGNSKLRGDNKGYLILDLLKKTLHENYYAMAFTG
jgi:hypothetical protein